MKHSESLKIYQVSRYHGNVKAVYSMIVLLTRSVEISGKSVANDNVNNDVILSMSRSFVAIFITPVLSDSLGHLV